MNRSAKKELRNRGLRAGRNLRVPKGKGLLFDLFASTLESGGESMDDGDYRKARKGERL